MIEQQGLLDEIQIITTKIEEQTSNTATNASLEKVFSSFNERFSIQLPESIQTTILINSLRI